MNKRRPHDKVPRPDFSDVTASRRGNMRAIRGRDTRPELIVRRLLHSLGYRFRLHRKDLPGRPDIVLSGRRAVIDVRGCFWHQHGDANCRNAVMPRARRDWWRAKLAQNVERDRANVAALEAAGWRVLVLWECQIKEHDQALAATLKTFLKVHGPGDGRPGSANGTGANRTG